MPTVFVALQMNAERTGASKHYQIQCCHRRFGDGRAIAAGFCVFQKNACRLCVAKHLSLTKQQSVVVKRAGNNSWLRYSSETRCVNVCNGTQPFTILPSVLERKSDSGSRLWSLPKECRVDERRETPSLARQPPVLVTETGNSSRPSSSLNKCWVHERC